MVNKREATIEDINYIATKLSTGDIEEILSLTNTNVLEALKESFYASQDCFVGEMNGKIFCIVGCIPGEEGANLWMLFTSDVQYLPISFFKISKKVLKEWIDKYGHIHNYTQQENAFILKWLKWLEFTIEPLSLLGKLEVHKFYKER
jgi:hypothetical protein